jgi:hypothetical protein
MLVGPFGAAARDESRGDCDEHNHESPACACSRSRANNHAVGNRV